MTSCKMASTVIRAGVIFILSFSLMLGHVNTARASAMTYQRDYSYQASESDSKISCRTLALEQITLGGIGVLLGKPYRG
jgi:hypothetical protein